MDITPEPKHALYRAIVFVMLLAVWLVFSGLFDPFHITLGVISCAFVTWLASDMIFADRTISLGRRCRQAFRMAGYLLWLLWQVLLANLHLLRLALSPRSKIQPHILRYHTKLETDFERFLLANSITLTPGTVTIKIMGDTFYIHAISDVAAGGLDGEMERRIARVFASEEAPSGSEA